MQEKACTNRPRQNAGRVARFYPQAMCYARWCKGLSGVCWSPALSQRETDRYPDVSHDASTHRNGFWFSWMLPRCGGCCVACRWRVLDFKRKRLRLAGKWHLFLGRRPCTSLGVGCEEVWTGQCGSPWRKNKSGALFGFDGCRHVSNSWAHLSGVGRFRCQTADQWQVAAQARLSCHKHGDSSCGNGAWLALRHCTLSVCRGRACVSKFAFLRSLAYPDICKKSVGNSFPIPRRIGFLSLPHFSERQGPDIRPALHRIAEAQRSVYNPSRGSVGIIPNIISWRNGVWPGVSRFFIFPRACRSGRARFHRLGRGSCALQSRAEALFVRLRPGKSGYWRKLAPQNTSTPAWRPLDVPDAHR